MNSDCVYNLLDSDCHNTLQFPVSFQLWDNRGCLSFPPASPNILPIQMPFLHLLQRTLIVGTFVKMIVIFVTSIGMGIYHLTREYHEDVESPKYVPFAPLLINYCRVLVVERLWNQ